MRMGAETQEGFTERGEKYRMQGFLHSRGSEESMKVELRVGVTQSRLTQTMRRGGEGLSIAMKPGEEGLVSKILSPIKPELPPY